MNKIRIYLVLLVVLITKAEPLKSQPLQLENAGTEHVFFSYHGKPLLSFGTMSDFIFYAADDAYEYKKWADWQAAHGMNHCRAYLPGSWTYIEYFAEENGGKKENVLFPFRETEPGSRQFDLTRFDQGYWKRFREQCEYLQSRGIIIDLLMSNGWQLFNYNEEIVKINWDGHFFNPENNINSCTDVLRTTTDEDNRTKIYHTVSDGNRKLLEIQIAYFEKIIEETHDLDNIYYELVHELAMTYDDWDKTSTWLEAIAKAVREKWQEYNPDRPIILSTDGGHLRGFPFNQGGGYPEPGSEMDWVFSHPYFDVLIDGNHHHTGNIKAWVKKYKKPYVAQESRDDSGQSWTYRIPEMRTQLRKYCWKMMMAKCQQIDIYAKPIHNLLPFEEMPGPSNNYDPNGWNEFENDALRLREFFNSIIDYGSLDYKGYFWISTVGVNLVLSSDKEILAYISSPTGMENMEFVPNGAHVFLQDLPFPDGQYVAKFFDPKSGPKGSRNISIKDGDTRFRTPVFVDDIMVHIVK
jgi:hypothetical protein